MPKVRFIKVWLGKFGVEELDRPAQSPDINPVKHLWDELELAKLEIASQALIH